MDGCTRKRYHHPRQNAQAPASLSAHGEKVTKPDSTGQNLASNAAEFLSAQIEKFVREDPRNRFSKIDGSPIFDSPLVGIANGYDPLFAKFKEVVGPTHLMPQEILEKTRTGSMDGEKHGTRTISVISWILPITHDTRLSNRRETKEPTRRWAHTRYFGEQLNDALRNHLVALLNQAGYMACAPANSSLFMRHTDHAGKDCSSNWSERHIAYAAGLGTFSLSDGFITPRGIAIRCGSVVTNLDLPPTPRPYENHKSNCLYFQGYDCQKCIQRCPAGAISGEGHDKAKCFDYTRSYWDRLNAEYEVGIAGCGLCQTGVPCEAMIPKAESHRAPRDVSNSPLDHTPQAPK